MKILYLNKNFLSVCFLFTSHSDLDLYCCMVHSTPGFLFGQSKCYELHVKTFPAMFLHSKLIGLHCCTLSRFVHTFHFFGHCTPVRSPIYFFNVRKCYLNEFSVFEDEFSFICRSSTSTFSLSFCSVIEIWYIMYMYPNCAHIWLNSLTGS